MFTQPGKVILVQPCMVGELGSQRKDRKIIAQPHQSNVIKLLKFCVRATIHYVDVYVRDLVSNEVNELDELVPQCYHCHQGSPFPPLFLSVEQPTFHLPRGSGRFERTEEWQMMQSVPTDRATATGRSSIHFCRIEKRRPPLPLARSLTPPVHLPR